MRKPILLMTLAIVSAFGAVRIDSGQIEGAASADGKIRAFKGVPYAAPPVGPLRWKAPQPVAKWAEVRAARDFGPHCVQDRIFGDMGFRDSGAREDCLYLNVWTPTTSRGRLPVMFWIHGGDFIAGASSEPRQDGENLARKGVVVVSLNYRLGVFGFLAHPGLTRESGRNSSGNYGYLDMVAALQWVKRNIAALAGDPRNVTIFGESAGSFAVSALMASPLSRGLFQKAIGESGAYFGPTLDAKPLAETEQAGRKLGESIEALRAKSPDEMLQAVRAQGPATRILPNIGTEVTFVPNVDGYFLREHPRVTFMHGKQARVPLLAGWNTDEGNFRMVFGQTAATAARFKEVVHNLFGKEPDEYPAANDTQAKRSAQDLAGDQFTAYSTWKWIELQAATGKPVFRYLFEMPPPIPARPGASPDDPPAGAYHSSEIEFVFETLASKNLTWHTEDKQVSELVSSYWTNFARTGDPNGPGLPRWPAYGPRNREVMHLRQPAQSSAEVNRSKYELLDKLNSRN